METIKHWDLVHWIMAGKFLLLIAMLALAGCSQSPANWNEPWTDYVHSNGSGTWVFER
jgi:hypothetical protein